MSPYLSAGPPGHRPLVLTLGLTMALLSACLPVPPAAPPSPSPTVTPPAIVLATYLRIGRDLALLAQERAEHPELRRFARQAIAAREDLLRSLPPESLPLPSASDADPLRPSARLPELRARLEWARPFDREWIDLFLPFTDEMLTVVAPLAETAPDPLRHQARETVSLLTAEQAQLRAWRLAWYGGGG